MIELDLYIDEYSGRSAGAPYGISAGGVVYRKQGKTYEFLLLGRSSEKGASYHLPKGTLHLGEGIESAAAREITEEAGVHVRLKTFIGGKQAIFVLNGKEFDKTFLYYVAEYIGESDPMDDEHDFREWFSYEDAIKKLETHIKQENVFVARAYNYLQNHG
jgi:8-oxo-dGTP pyrophosphatase MutT (NUDIX family)